MAAKSIKGKNTGGKSAQKPSNEIPKKESSKPKDEVEDEEEFADDDNIEIENVKAPSKKTAKTSAKKGKDNEDEDEDDEGDEKEIVDEWEKPEEEPEEWDPDFEEFDLPKSKAKKSGIAGGKKGGKGEEEDELGLDEELKDLDLFNDSALDDEEDDY